MKYPLKSDKSGYEAKAMAGEGLEILKWALRQDRSGDTEKEGKRHSTPTFQGHFVSESFFQSGETDGPSVNAW